LYVINRINIHRERVVNNTHPSDNGTRTERTQVDEHSIFNDPGVSKFESSMKNGNRSGYPGRHHAGGRGLWCACLFLIRRWFVGSNDATPAGLWLRFTVLLFGFCLIALIEGVLLHPYGLFWFVPVVGTTLIVVAKIAPKLLR
jgi:hypothetical protein